ncbi:DNA polymerase III subunit gamma/tau [Aureitalea marina]|uniref:DNA polymerase III subunit gamma/tau n=1 Tax=Aureitalea marina TaxID=930804 RepID=A0A2S7KNV6_9FLAO|nr:DNA polymerase III subunit gamma/tau [Aureitalea marina]PQB04309.1 DNA polymerase III, subunit gamma and tau [Aureitalea marina]
MEHFIVSARKYRPTRFEDVVGQQAITNTLENAIAQDHLAQALLFTGPRGVGKTTCARILAKRINEDEDHQKEEDFAFNIFELDAASNNSVDDIRSLIDQVRIPPQIGKYKVYIIDEVHMLSSSAFNAFLKTLEEPPSHAIFILATTEKHKIIPTILSRCQIFDFRRITVQDIKEQLAKVAEQEGIDAEDDALHLIAQKADGAMRDALSIFDRVVSFAGNKLTRQTVAQNLHVLDHEVYLSMTDMILAHQIPELLSAFNEVLASGFDGRHFISGLASHFRDLLVGKNPQTLDLLEVGLDIRKRYLEQAKEVTESFLMQAIDLANSCDLEYKSSRNQRLLVELCLMKLASIGQGLEKKKTSLKILPPVKNPGSKEEARPEIPVKQDNPIAKPINPESELSKPAKEDDVSPEPTELSTEPDVQAAKRLVKRNAEKVSGLSLKSVRKKKELELQRQSRDVQRQELREEFTEGDMLDAWNSFASKIEKDGRFNLHSHLSMGVPRLEGHLIHLVFPNSTIKVELERAKPELLRYIRTQLKNDQVDLSIEVNETETKRYAYTPREKFELMKKKNPLVEDLRKSFDLDI